MLQARVVWPAKSVAAVEAAIFREGIVSAAELACHLFVGGPAPRNKDHVESCESKDGNDEHADDNDDHDGHDAFRGRQVAPVIEQVDEAEDEDCCHVEREGDEKHEEIAVVAPADAVVHPRAVVVKYLYAAVAYGAVGAPGWPVELAGDAPLHAHCNPIYLDVPIERRAKVIVSVLIGGRSRNHPGVHEGCQAEVHKNEEGDDAFQDRHKPHSLLQEVPLYTREVKEEGGDGEEQRPRERRGQELCLVLSAARHLIGLVKCGGSSPED